MFGGTLDHLDHLIIPNLQAQGAQGISPGVIGSWFKWYSSVLKSHAEVLGHGTRPDQIPYNRSVTNQTWKDGVRTLWSRAFTETPYEALLHRCC